MQIENNPYEIKDGEWIVRVRQPNEAGSSRTVLMLHGLTGDETVMWIFAHSLPRDAWLFAPRAPLSAPGGGFSWLARTGEWPTLEDFSSSAADLIEAFSRWSAQTGAPGESFDVMGFSQGAALSYALAAFYPQRVNRVIALAGFLPIEDPLPGRYSSLNGKKVYIAHGAKDATVPVEKARQAVSVLQTAGCDVTYCESEVGHKLSAACLKGLEAFTG